MTLNLDNLDYKLPDNRIAKYPLEKREDAKLLCLNKIHSGITHTKIKFLPNILKQNDLIVFNNTKVNNWRFYGNLTTGGRVETLLYERKSETTFLALLSANRKIKENEKIKFKEGVSAIVEFKGEKRFLRFSANKEFENWLSKDGDIPIPPYLRRKSEPIDHERYQTIFSKNPGSIAAPTAGFHFSKKLIQKIIKNKINIAEITLDIGIGTFAPIRSKDFRKHKMHSEKYDIPKEVVNKIEHTHSKGGKVIAIGTTVTRALESSYVKNKKVVNSGKGTSNLFITPGYEFRVIDGLLTNFHLPKSTLLSLIIAFAGKKSIEKAYTCALTEDYRFYSYGDAMLIT
ncbi:MAG: tRNA preQ1(34) S-adenosylmethionine ribosyltransferase-isomerase QueA [bacterium]